jgi:hypothetical protein
MNDRVQKEQTLPAEFASVLRTMRAEKDQRLSTVLAIARMNGWTYQAMGSALGVSRQAIQQAISRAELDVRGGVPEVPLPPRKPQSEAKPPRRRLLVNDELAERLREMQRVAATVNGVTPADAPERKISVEFTAQLHALTQQGVSVYHLADVLGVAHNAIRSRLARHGYRSSSPSQAERYIGHPNARAAGEQTHCKYGHELSGENLYVIPKTGKRVCRACSSRRSRAYQERKRQAEAAE